MSNDIFELIRLFLPKWLTPEQQRELFSDLKAFPHNQDIYLAPQATTEELLQGDCWKGFVAIDFKTRDAQRVTGLVLSNSCDIDVANKHMMPPSILFSPLISMSRFAELLEKSGKTPEQVKNSLDGIRSQQVTDIIYLPQALYGAAESLVVLSDIHSHPLSDFLSTNRSRVFRLNQYGFYVLLLKLSIHFSRFQENVTRMTA